MLSSFYDLMNHPENYRAVWRGGELYVEPLADDTYPLEAASAEATSSSTHSANKRSADLTPDSAPTNSARRAA
jgi:hypothetical protein